MSTKRSSPHLRLLCVGLLLALAVGKDLAAQSGVLLGLATPSVNHEAAEYRTLWITTTDDSAAVMATGPGILVPRRDGFWHVDLIRSCTSFVPWDSEMCDRLVDIVKSPEQHQTIEPKVIVTDPDTLGADGPCWLRTTNRLRFVGTDHVSVDVENYSEGCSASGWNRDERLALYEIDRRSVALDDNLVRVRLAQLVGTEVTAAVDSSREAFFAGGGQGDGDCESYRGIGIARGKGRWEVFGWSAGIHVCGAPFDLYSSGLAAPASLVGHDELFPSLDTLKALIPDVRDAVASPRRDLVVALTAHELLAIRVHEGRLGAPQPLATLTGDIIMVQWALGRYVTRWTEEVTPLLSR